MQKYKKKYTYKEKHHHPQWFVVESLELQDS